MEELEKPFEGFDEASMRPIWSLMRGDSKGRLLLTKVKRKLGLRNENDLTQILDFCNAEVLKAHPDRRGLFTQETAHYYREKGEKAWKTTTLGGMEMLEDPESFPIADRKRYSTGLFDHMELAFRPRICLRTGLNTLQAYLILYHELTHLEGLKPFDPYDLFSFNEHNKEKRFYHKRLMIPGGEMEAYLAQIAAFRRLRDRYQIPARLAMEGFLTERGKLLVREQPAFLAHLLDAANYRYSLDAELDAQIVFQYNQARSWWEAFESVLEGLDEQLSQITALKEKASKAQKQAESEGATRQAQAYADQFAKLEQQRLDNRRRYRDTRVEQKGYIQLLERIDERYSREE